VSDELAVLVLLVLLSSASRAKGGKWVPPPGEDPFPVVPLPPNPLEPKR
jgi:hypothetical protein